MTRNEAKMVAMELYKLIHKDVKAYISEAVRVESDEILSASEAAKYMGCSISFLYHHQEIPRLKVGKTIGFKKSSLMDFMNR